MSDIWIYNNNAYITEAEVNAAVTALKNRLDNNPTDWVVVKEVTSNGEGGWIVTPTPLTDEEINNLDTTKYYNVNSVPAGDTFIGLTGEEAAVKVVELRFLYSNWIRANVIVKQYAPTNEDMSGYVDG